LAVSGVVSSTQQSVQRIITGVVKAADVVAIEALITDLHPRAERSESRETFDSKSNSLCRRYLPRVLPFRFRFARKSSAGAL
jgi:hypothetical protein